MQKIKTKYLNITLILIFSLAIIGLIFGSVFDEEISRQIYLNYPFSDVDCVNAPVISVIFSASMIPTCVFGTFAGTILITQTQKSKFWTWLFRVGGIIAILVINWSTCTSSFETGEIYQLTANSKVLVNGIILGIIILLDILTVFLTLKFTKNADKNDKFWVALTIVVFIALYFVSDETVKYLVSRPRPRAIYSSFGETYRDWWEFRPFYAFKLEDSSYCKSFVSGHTATVGTYIAIVPLVMSLFKISEKKWACAIGSIIAAVYAFFVAFTRLFAQAHFLSDVMAGLTNILLVGFILYWLMPKIRRLVEKKTNN